VVDYLEHKKQYYDRRASEYEHNEAFREEPSEDLPGLLHAISLLPPAGVLDVACGTGSLTQHLGSDLTGLDQSEAMLRRLPVGACPGPSSYAAMPFGCFFYGLLPLEDRGRFLEEARRVGQELILVEPTPAWVPDGSRYEIYRRYFTADRFAEELDGRILFAGRWMVMAKVGG
jgi:SAM-dependent methyltransferase